MPPRTLSPWDLHEPTALHELTGVVRLAGRVRSVSGPHVEIADDVATVIVSESAEQAALCEPGGFAVFEGQLVTKGEIASLTSVRLVDYRSAGVPLKPDGETARLHSGVGRALRSRAELYAAIRRFFAVEGFVEVETPSRVLSPGTDVYIEPIASEDHWLITSPELHMKRLVVGGMPRIYQIARCYRGSEQGPWHEPEFTMLEWYEAFASQEELMEQTERLVAYAATELCGAPVLTLPRGAEVRLEPPFLRMTVQDAFAEYAGVADAAALAARDDGEFFQRLVDLVEPALVGLGQPVFLHEYPVALAALAQSTPGRPETAERFELYVGGVELCNGYGELTDAAAQRARFEKDLAVRRKRGLPALPLDERFLEALAEGMPPCSGNALGVDRLLALCLGSPTLDRVRAFPQRWL